MSTRPSRRPIVAFTAGALLLAACAGSDGGSGVVSGGEDAAATASAGSGDGEGQPNLTMLIGSDLSDVDPQKSYTTWTGIIGHGNVAESLIVPDADGQLTALLAEDWEVVDDTTWRVTLREGVEFHNGEPFDAEAAVFSIERIIDPEYGAQHSGFLGAIAGAEVVDETTIDVLTNGSQPFLPNALTFVPMVPPEHTQSSPTALEEDVIGTGPYTMTSRTLDTVTLERNPDYWGGETNGPEVVTLRGVPEVSGRISALQANEADIIHALPPTQVDSVPAYTAINGGGVVNTQLNAAKPPFDDPDVRRAAVLAVDAEGITDSLLGDLARRPQCQYGFEGIEGFDPDIPAQEYDPDEAAALLESSSYDGTPVRLAVPQESYPQADTATEVMAEQLQAVGFTVELMVVDFNGYLDIIHQEPADRVEAFTIRSSFDSGSVLQPWGQYIFEQGFAQFPYDDLGDVVETAQTAVATIDDDERNALLSEAARGICEADTAIFLYSPDGIYGHAPDVSFPARNDERFPFTEVTRG